MVQYTGTYCTLGSTIDGGGYRSGPGWRSQRNSDSHDNLRLRDDVVDQSY